MTSHQVPLSIIGCALLGGLANLAACNGTTEPPQGWQWATLAASQPYTCGLSATGEAFCWGWVPGYFTSPFGPDPDPDSVPPKSAVPLRVPGDVRFTDVTVGALSICGLDSERRAYCWGANQMGEAGDSSYIAKRHPAPVAGDYRWRMISAGGAHTCGVTVDHRAYCWGDTFRGQLGNGDLTYGGIPYPAPVAGDLEWDSVYAGGGTSCGITTAGDAYCWGVGDRGVLGDGQPPKSGVEKGTPSQVVGDHRFTSLTVGPFSVCGISEDARAYCWGVGGMLGNGGTASSSSPVPVGGDLQWVSLSAGDNHTCGLTVEHAAYCWGYGQLGGLGNGDTTIALVPQPIGAPGTYAAITVGGYHTCARTTAGVAFCWGQGDYGQLGDGIFETRLWPVRVADPGG